MRSWMSLAGPAFCAVLLVGCAGNPQPGDRDYPYNLSGVFEASVDAMGVEYVGPATLSTSPGGMVYGVLDLEGAERVVGNIEGSITGDTLTFDSSYERGGGCTGMMSGEGRITEGGEAVAGIATVSDDCAGDLFDAVFTFNRTSEE